jgi:hypothetical protein
LVAIGAFVMLTGGALTIISLVDGIEPDTAFVETGGFDELFPQPAAVNKVVPSAAAIK